MRNHAEVAHAWAAQKKTAGKASNLFFEGPIIYSYGTHFPIAKMFSLPVGDFVLFTSKSYSNSTAKHKNRTLAAVNHLRVYTVPVVDPRNEADHAANLAAYQQRIEEHQRKALRARSYAQQHQEQAEAAAIEFNQYANVFELDAEPIDPETLFDKSQRDRIKQQMAAETKRQREKTAERNRKAAESLAKWAAGTGSALYGFNSLPVVLRVHERRVESSHGASVSIDEAREFLAKVDKAGEDINGLEVGQFKANRYEDGHMVIGCHRIPLAEVEKIRADITV